MIIGRRQSLVGAGACLLAGIGVSVPGPPAAASPHTSSLAWRLAIQPDAIGRVATHRRMAFLTFDDGPDPDYTPTVLEILARFEVPATFFMIGRNLQAYPELAYAVAARGHRIANHTQNHLWLDTLPDRAVRAELGAWEDSATALRLPNSGLFRPPRGWTNATVGREAAALGLRTAFWTNCLEAQPAALTARAAGTAIARSVVPGSVLLLHDGGHLDGPNPQSIDRGRTVAALPYLLTELQRRRFALGLLPA